jgi:hypothetical protein
MHGSEMRRPATPVAARIGHGREVRVAAARLRLDGITSYAVAAFELRAADPAQTLYDLLAPHHAQIPFINTLGFLPAPVAASSKAGRSR